MVCVCYDDSGWQKWNRSCSGFVFFLVNKFLKCNPAFGNAAHGPALVGTEKRKGMAV